MSPHDERVGSRRLALVQLRGHVGVVDSELFIANRLDALQLTEFLNVLEAALSVAGGLGEISHLLRGVFVLLDVRHQTRDLIAIDHRDPEHVVFGTCTHGIGDRCRRPDGSDHRDLFLRRYVLPGEGVARIRRSEDGDDLLVVDQVRHVLDGLRRLREIVPDDEGQFSAENAASLVDIVDRSLKTKGCGLPAQG